MVAVGVAVGIVYVWSCGVVSCQYISTCLCSVECLLSMDNVDSVNLRLFSLYSVIWTVDSPCCGGFVSAVLYQLCDLLSVCPLRSFGEFIFDWKVFSPCSSVGVFSYR